MLQLALTPEQFPGDSQTGNATQSRSTIPKSQTLSASPVLWDIVSSALAFARLSTLRPHFTQSKSGILTRFRFTSFHSFVSSEPRSSSTI